MNLLKSNYFRSLPSRRAKRASSKNLYPLLGVLLLIVTALLSYGAMYFLLTA
jgi:hypothetical protein